MTYRVTIEEERLGVPVADRGQPAASVVEFQRTHIAEVPDKATLASVLRGIADRLDPPKVSY